MNGARTADRSTAASQQAGLAHLQRIAVEQSAPPMSRPASAGPATIPFERVTDAVTLTASGSTWSVKNKDLDHP
jgi:hypothetical protein